MNVLITGAANGIGQAVTKKLLSKNIKVYAIDICNIDITDNNLISYQLDITDITKLNDLLNNFKESNITFDAIINIAGIFIIDSFIEVNNESLKKIFDVNFFGTININKIFFPLLKPNGRIIITSSEVAPLDPMPFNGIYNVTKTALDSYSQALRQELNLLGYKVITIRPGAFNTALANNSLVKTKELMEKTTLYIKHSKNFYNLVNRFMGKPSNVNKITNIYYKALSKKKPKLIYKKHTNILLVLLNLLPKRIQCFLIKMLINKK